MDSAVSSKKKKKRIANEKDLVCPQYGSSLDIAKLGPRQNCNKIPQTEIKQVLLCNIRIKFPSQRGKKSLY